MIPCHAMLDGGAVPKYGLFSHAVDVFVTHPPPSAPCQLVFNDLFKCMLQPIGKVM